VNPFVFHRPVSAEAVIAREADAAALLDAVTGGVNATLYAPRRYGKTTLIAKVLAEAEAVYGMAAVTVDCYGVLTREDFAARLTSAYRALPGRTGRRVGALLESVGAGVQVAGTGASLTAKRRVTSSEGLLIDLLDLPLGVLERTGRTTVVAFDEFQAITDVPGLDGLVRSRIQYHGEAAVYVFAGSEPSLLGAMFTDRSRPLYGQAQPFRLGPLPARETHEAIAARFEATQRSVDPRVLGELVATGAGHPQRTMLLAHRLWAATPARGEATDARWRVALAATLAQLTIEFEALWTAMTANERRIVAAVAGGLSPLSRDGRAVGLRGPSSAQKAIEALIRRGMVERGDGGLHIVDPLLALWVAELRAT
jgi:hypothetical protein